MWIKLTDGATIPTRATRNSAGYDLYALDTVHMEPGDTEWVKTGIGWSPSGSLCGLVLGRSGLARKGIVIAHIGLIDADYRGDITVGLRNLSGSEWACKAGDRIAQIIVMDYHTFTDRVVRGRDGGFGSTG